MGPVSLLASMALEQEAISVSCPGRRGWHSKLCTAPGASHTSPLLSQHWAPLTTVLTCQQAPVNFPLFILPHFCGLVVRGSWGSASPQLPPSLRHLLAGSRPQSVSSPSLALGLPPCHPAAHWTLPYRWLFGLTRVPATPSCISHCLLSL